jgi:hypothetical protein
MEAETENAEECDIKEEVGFEVAAGMKRNEEI